MTQHSIPAFARLPQLLVKLGLFSTYRKAETHIKRGNVYIEINPDDPERSYWLRVDEVESYICIPSHTRIKHITDESTIEMVTVHPHIGRTKD